MSEWTRFGSIEYEYFTSLMADRMYLYAAAEALKRAEAAWKVVERHQRKVDELKRRIDRIEAHYEGDIPRMAEKSERPSIALVERANPGLETAYGLFAAEAALVHVCCAAAAEAFINARAANALSGADFERFDKVPIDGKWQFLPRVLGRKGLEPGKPPLQGLIQVIKYRNGLMHHKAKRERWEIGAVAPKTLQKLGLSLAAAQKSLKAVTDSIRRMATLLPQAEDKERSVPSGFFKWELETRPLTGQTVPTSTRLSGE